MNVSAHRTILLMKVNKMAKAMTISYVVGDNLYLNLTNKCPCACTFCIRNHADGWSMSPI